jgi:hypothetical protein
MTLIVSNSALMVSHTIVYMSISVPRGPRTRVVVNSPHWQVFFVSLRQSSYWLIYNNTAYSPPHVDF